MPNPDAETGCEKPAATASCDPPVRRVIGHQACNCRLSVYFRDSSFATSESEARGHVGAELVFIRIPGHIQPEVGTGQRAKLVAKAEAGA